MAYSITASDTFAGLTTGQSLSGRACNNLAGGSWTGLTWAGFDEYAGASGYAEPGYVWYGQYIATAVRDTRIRFMRQKVKLADTKLVQIFGFGVRADNSNINCRRIGVWLDQNHTRLAVVEKPVAGNGSVATRASIPVTPPTGIIWLELDATVGHTVTARMFAADGTTLLATVSHTFTEWPPGDGWGFGGYYEVSANVFGEVQFGRATGYTPPTLTTPTVEVTGSATAVGTVSVDSAATVFYIASTGTPDSAAIKASSLSVIASAAGAVTLPLTGLTPGTTGYKLHTIAGIASGDDSAITRSLPFNTPALMPAPTGSVTVTNPVGQTVTVSGTYSGTVSSASATLPPATTPNGATLQGPISVTFGGGTFSVTFTNVPFGSYNPPAVTLSNTDSSGTIYGTAFDLLSMGGEPEGPPPGGEAAPAITSQPSSQTVVAGQTVTFSIVATGGGLSYQWQRNPGGNTSFANISGANAASYTTPATTSSGGSANNADTYRVIVTNTQGSATSSAATLTVTAVVAPTVVTQPASQTILAGSTVTVSASINDGGGTLSYQWASSPDGTTWTNVGTNSPSYTSAALTTGQSGIRYRLTATNSAGTVVSASAVITVNAAVVAPTITTQPANQSIADGQTAVLSVVATTGGATLSYQWQFSTNGGTSWSNVNTNGTQNPFTTLALATSQSGIQYRVIVTNSAGSVTSNAATITVNAAVVAPTITTQPASQTITAGGTVALSVVATTGGGTLAYQWASSPDGTSWSNVGTNAASYTSGALSAGSIQYRVTVTNAAGNVVSTAAVITVNAAADTTPPAMTGSIAVTGKTHNAYTLTWQAATDGPTGYERSLDGGTNWVDVGNVLTVNIASRTPSTTDQVRVRAYDAAGNKATPLSVAVALDAAPDTTPPVMAGSITVSAKTHNAYTLAWQAATDGPTGYERSLDGGTSWTDLGNVLTVNVTGRTPSATDQVRVRAYDAAGNKATALSVAVTLDAAPDTTAPTMSGTVSLSNLTHNSYTTGCDAATDNVGVTAYAVSQDGGTSWTDKGTARTHDHTGRTPGATDQVQWRARDAAGNWSTVLSRAVTLNAAPALAGFDFDSGPGMVFGDLAGALANLSRLTSVSLVARAYHTSTGALVATSSTLTTTGLGRLPRWEHASLVVATPYAIVFTRVSDGEVCATLMTAT